MQAITPAAIVTGCGWRGIGPYFDFLWKHAEREPTRKLGELRAREKMRCFLLLDGICFTVPGPSVKLKEEGWRRAVALLYIPQRRH